MAEKILTELKIEHNNSGAYCGNAWSVTQDQGKINALNPADGKILATISKPNIHDYENTIKAAEHAFLNWRQVPAPKRGEIIRQIAQILRAKKSLLGHLVSLESGKSKAEGEGEVQEMIDMADFAVGQSRMLYGLTMPSERFAHRLYEQWHPLGPIAVITAFNFPVAVWAWNAFLAIVCGNTVIWKPSPKGALCALAIQHICNEVMSQNSCEGIFSLFITDDIPLTEKLVQDVRLPLISFTGSTSVGLKIYETVAKRMGRCLLECSGNNAVIIDESADLNLALQAVLFGAIGTAGQRCTSIRRLILHESVYEIFLKNLIAAYSAIKIGDPLDEKNLMGPLIDSHAVQIYQQALNEVKELGGKILFGGRILDRPGFYVEPTIIEAQNNWSLVQRETFAPILYVMKFKIFEEAVAMNNNVKQGLSSALFTNNLKHTEYFLSATGSDCGIANINIGTSGAEIGGAFGGEKQTGGGREAGSDSWKSYMRRQTVTINWSSKLPLAQGIQFKNPTS